MEQWRKNVYILWVALFFFMASMSMVIPFLPLYIQELGVTDKDAVTIWTGIIFGVNFLSAFIFSPIWGTLADRYGRKLMLLRSGFGMMVTIGLMGLASNPLQLLLLRFVNGMISGFMPAAISLTATNTPKEKSGYALGMLQSGGVAGTIFGPFIGGILAEFISFHQIFYITSAVIGIVTIAVMLFVKEDFKKVEVKKKTSLKGGFATIIKTEPLPALFTVGFLIQFSIMSAQPQMSLYVQEIHPSGQYIAFFAGLVPAVTGFANMLASPWLGKLGDQKGSQYVLFYSMVGATAFLIPQAFVTSITGLLISRFLFGLAIGGLLPSVNALIRRSAPAGQESATYGYSNSALFLGNMLGPVLGGLIASFLSVRAVLLFGAALFFISTLWMKYIFENRVDESKRLRLKRNFLPE